MARLETLEARTVLSSVSGVSFNDVNGNGLQDAGEEVLAGTAVYLDQNNNGTLDPGEQSTTTDGNGEYVFDGLSVGEYIVREEIPSGHEQTVPLYGESFYAYAYIPDSGGLMQPALIDPTTGDVQRLGTPDSGTRLHGLIRTNDGEFFGLNRSGSYSARLFSLDINTNVKTEVGVVNGDVACGLAYDPAGDTIYALAVEAGGGALKLAVVDRTNGQLTFVGNGTDQMTGTSGLAWDPARDVMIGFDNGDDQFWQFDKDGNASLIWDTSGLDGWGLAYNGTNLSLFARLVGGNDSFWEIDPYAQTAEIGLQASEPIPMESLDYYRVHGGHLVYVGEGDTVTGLDFGNQEVVNALMGTKFNDVDGNGVQDPGELGLRGVTIYLDEDNNGELDPGEQSTTTGASGDYVFNNLPVGEYIVREVVPDGYLPTAPLYSESFYAYTYVPSSGGQMQPARIDPATGEVLRLGTPATGDRLHGLVRTNDGTFYGMNGFGSAPDRLYSLDINTNVKTEIAPINHNVAWGMAYDPESDTIYVLGRDPLDDALKLASVDRATGELTFFGDGTHAMTGTSGLAWDPVREVVIGFDNSDDQFWQFDRAGNAELLWDTSGLNGWGFSYNGCNFSLLSQVGDGSDTFWEIDPYAQTAELGLQASEPIPMEALDYYRVDGGHLAYIGEGDVVTGLDFGNFQLANALVGTKYQDVDGNGVRDAGEPGMAGVVVYLDQNNNGTLDPGEQSTTTDEQGEYLFNGLPVGEYVVREVVPEGYRQTAPLYGESFYAYAYSPIGGGHMQPTRIDPATGDVRWLGTPVTGDRLHGLVRTNDGEFFGLNGWGQFTDRFFSLDINTNVKTELGDINGDVAWGLAYDPASDTIYALAQESSGGPLKLATVDRSNGQLTFIGSGTSQMTATGGLAWDPGRNVLIGFDNADDQFWEFDTDGNATLIWDTSGLDGWGLAHDGSHLALHARRVDGNDRLWDIDPYAQTAVLGLQASEAIPMESLDYYRVDGGHLAYVSEGEVVTGLDFGNEEIVNALIGTKFDDVDGDGIQDPGEPGMVGIVVYLDQNNSGELDPGEQWTTTDANGEYLFNNLPVGEYIVREVVPEGYRQTAPQYGESYYAYLYVPNSGGYMQPGRIDPQTGEVLRLGTPVRDRIHGLVRTNDGEYFGLNGSGSAPDWFFSLDINTNEHTQIALINGNAKCGLAYDAATDTIYGLGREGSTGNAQLAIVDRATGQYTYIGTGTAEATSISGLAWDPDRGVLIGFDNADDQFWEFDTEGNATLLWDTSGLDGWGLAHNGSNLVLHARRVDGNDRLWDIDPYAQTAVLGLQASEAIPMEALDYFRVDGGHLAYVSQGDVITGLDFGNQINLPPVADAGGPYAVDEGGSVSLDGSASFDPEGYPIELLWDLDGDGLFGEVGDDAERGDEVGATPTFSAAGLDGPIPIHVELKVIDDLGAFDIASATIEVLNVAPVITEISSDATFDNLGAEDAAVTVTASFVDAGIPDTHTAVVDWGDGSLPEPATVTEDGGSGSVSASHAYANGGVFTVTLTVTDDDSGEAVATTQTVIVGAGIKDGVLQVVGNDDANHVTVNKQGNGWFKVHADFFPEANFRRFDTALVDSIQIWLGDGDDHATVAGSIHTPVIMYGGGGDDHLKGGGGRDILIGGVGADLVNGGPNDDILIGGTTDYDFNDVALLALLMEWDSDRTYEERVANISTSSGPILADLDIKLDEETVQLDEDYDQLNGASGDDWFFGTEDEIHG